MAQRNGRMDLPQRPQGGRQPAGPEPDLLEPVQVIRAAVKAARKGRAVDPVDRDLTFSRCWLALHLSR
jgi:hypothetical protein